MLDLVCDSGVFKVANVELEKARQAKSRMTRRKARLTAFNQACADLCRSPGNRKYTGALSLLLPSWIEGGDIPHWLEWHHLLLGQKVDVYPPIASIGSYSSAGRLPKEQIRQLIKIETDRKTDPKTIVAGFAIWYKEANADVRTNSGELLKQLKLPDSQMEELLNEHDIQCCGYMYGC